MDDVGFAEVQEDVGVGVRRRDALRGQALLQPLLDRWLARE